MWEFIKLNLLVCVDFVRNGHAENGAKWKKKLDISSETQIMLQAAFSYDNYLEKKKETGGEWW